MNILGTISFQFFVDGLIIEDKRPGYEKRFRWKSRLCSINFNGWRLFDTKNKKRNRDKEQKYKKI